MAFPTQVPPGLKPAAWGVVGGVVAAAIIGFGTGWVVTSGSAQETAQRKAEQAVIASLTPVCVAQFKQQSAQRENTSLAALEETDSWERGDYVAEEGWATMPGSKDPKDEVAEACANELMKLAEKSAG